MASLSTEQAPSTWSLDLIGGFTLMRPDGAQVQLPTRKAEMLLAYLAVPAGASHGRSKLASLLWGDRNEEQARASLRNALAAIRTALGPGAVKSKRDTVELAADALALDVELLEAAAAGSQEIEEGRLRSMVRAELLEGRSAPTPELEDWLAFERTRRRKLAFDAGRQFVARCEERGDLGRAVDMAESLLTLDPLREKTQRLLIRLLAAAGERSRAAAQFDACKALLARELGVGPAPETVALATELLASGPPVAASVTLAAVSAPEGITSTAYGIAVLPFTNIGGDPEQNYIAEGLVEDLITELSRHRDFSVIARQSSGLFSGRPETAAVAASELSVRYALSGGLRRAGDRIRVTVQLIDAQGNRCIWAERYDRVFADIFALQDEIIASIIANIDAEVRHEERERALRKLPDTLDAWDMFHRGLSLIYRFNREANLDGDGWFRKAIVRSPDFALPYAGLAYSNLVKAMWYFAPDPAAAIVEGIAQARLALERDPANAFASVALGRLMVFAGDLPGAIHHLRAAIALNPSFAQAHYGLAQALTYAGEPEAALKEIDVAMKLSPKDPLVGLFLTLKSFCYFSLNDFAAAEIAARTATQVQSRETWSRLALAAALVQLGRQSEAAQAVTEARRLEPGLSLATFTQLIRHGSQDTQEKILWSLTRAGID